MGCRKDSWLHSLGRQLMCGQTVLMTATLIHEHELKLHNGVSVSVVIAVAWGLLHRPRQ